MAPNPSPRWFNAWPIGILTLFLGLVPCWFSWHAMAAVVTGKEPLSLEMVAWSLGPLVFAAPLFVLAYRLFTGRGRRSDGGLMGPVALAVCSVLTCALGLFGFYFAWRDMSLQAAIGGLVSSSLGVGGIRLARQRLRPDG